MPIALSRRGLVAATAASLAMPWVSRAQALKSEYKLSVVGNRPIPLSDGAFQWAELVTERTGGRINVKVYPGSQLVGGDQTRELLAMRQGVIDFCVSSTINLSPQIREMNLFSLPFLMPSHRAFDALIGGEVGQELFRVMAARDVVPLAWGENGFRELSNSRRPIRAPEDLKGLKIRFAAGAIFSDIFTALGANPVQMTFADLQPALSTGAVDGQENPINLFLAFRMDQLAQRHLTVWNYCADAGIFHVAKGVWESFSAQDKEIVAESAREAARRQIAAARRGITAQDRSSFEELARRGVAVVELSDAEKQAFARATRAVFDAWAQRTGAELVRKAEAAIRAVS
ncbi:MAG: TRAP transporter substrate-binding protein DctP [Acetobacteraceae bacterium]|nr:TRAP transporter substrate-binding protein DctP [Acetobacteraceae bacterium]